MKLCHVKGKGPTVKAVLISRLEDTKLKENEEILSLLFLLAVLSKQIRGKTHHNIAGRT